MPISHSRKSDVRVKLQLVLFAAVVAMLGTAACGAEEDLTATPTTAPITTSTAPPAPLTDGPRDATLDIGDFAHQSVTVQVGSSVVWTNRGGTAHTSTSGEPGNQTGLWDTVPFIGAGESSDPVLFNTVGDFPFFCRFHNSMTGFVTVVEDLGEGWGGTTVPEGATPSPPAADPYDY